MINIENMKLPFDEDGETKTVTVSVYSYKTLVEKAAQLESIKNMAMLHDVVRSDLILAVCGIIQEDEI